MTIDELVDNFNALEEWEDRYKYLIDLGNTLPPMDESLKTPGTRVSGCMAQVWMVLGWNKDHRLNLVADSDADIVKGLIRILDAVYAGRTATEIMGLDIEGMFDRLGLNHITSNRRNGFFSMVQRIKGFTSAPYT